MVGDEKATGILDAAEALLVRFGYRRTTVDDVARRAGHALFRRITDRFPSGALALDTHNWLGIRGVNRTLKRLFGAPLLHWAINDAHELERVNLGLRCTDAVSAMSPILVDALPPGAAPRGSKLICHLAQLIPPLRNLSLMARYEFGAASAAGEPVAGSLGQKDGDECGECRAGEQAGQCGVPEGVDGPVVRQ